MVLSEEQQYRKMTETPVTKLIVSLAIPTIISMLITSIYNLADTYFVSDLGNSQSGAIGIVSAMMAIIQAIGFMFGHGAGSNISRALGEKDHDKAKRFASTSFFYSLLVGLMFMALGLLFLEPFTYFLGSTDTILPYAKEYGIFILIGAPAMMSSCVMNNILRYEGKAFYAMIGLVSGGLINIVLDALFIQVFGFGVWGAGLATCISQYIGFFILLYMFISGKTSSRFSLRFITKDYKEIFSIFANGSPSLARQGLNSISMTVLNHIVKPYGDPAIAAMSIVMRVIGLFFSVGLGLGQGFQPVSGYNYGAKKYSRVKKAFLMTFLISSITMLVFSSIGIVLAPNILYLMRKDELVVNIALFAFQGQCVGIVFLPLSVAGNMLFQSIGKSGRALFLACMRSGLCFIPILFIMDAIFGFEGVKVAQGVSDLLSSLLTIPFVVPFLKNLPKDE